MYHLHLYFFCFNLNFTISIFILQHHIQCCKFVLINLYVEFHVVFSGYGTLREEKPPQIFISHSHQLGSNPSIYSGGLGHGSQHSTSSLDRITSPTSQTNKPANLSEDLYSWMAKQQEFVRENDKSNFKGNWVRNKKLKKTIKHSCNCKCVKKSFVICQVFRTEQKTEKKKVHFVKENFDC